LGWQALALPETYGGADGGLLDLGLVFEEVGRALYPSPLFTTVALGALPVLDVGTEAQRKAILPKVASGELIMTLALTEATNSWEPSGVKLTAEKAGDSFALNGTKLFIENAHVAHKMLVAARTSTKAHGVTVFIVDGKTPGISMTPLKTIGSDRQFEVTFKDVRVKAADVLGKVDEGWPVIDHAIARAGALQAAEMAGGARKILEMATEYAKSRVQFGRPIGSFQVLQHMLADMVINVDAAQLLAYEALWTLDEKAPAGRICAAAKAWASDAYRDATTVSNQIHGGIAYITEFDHQLWLRRAKALELKLGHARVHRERYARAVGF
ncbi:MAG: acyl-CoA dehydrogenase family protein, partial [Chloroflexota bacterium]